MLIVHEVMGRHCGWLTAATAGAYDRWLGSQRWLPEFGLSRDAWDMHAIYVPEAAFDLEAEADRLKAVMDEVGNVTIFLSEGAGLDSIVAEMEASGEEIPRDPFGHVKIDKINPGAWFAKQFAGRLGAEKVLVQKSGYFARSAPPNETDLLLIKSMTDYAVGCALRGISGVVGHDEEQATSCGPSSSTGSRAARSSTSTSSRSTSSCCERIRSTGAGGGRRCTDRPDSPTLASAAPKRVGRIAATTRAVRQGGSGDRYSRMRHRVRPVGRRCPRPTSTGHPRPGRLRVRPGSAARLPGRPRRPVRSNSTASSVSGTRPHGANWSRRRASCPSR